MSMEIFDMDRRALMQRLALLLGASALPADALAAVAAKRKRFLPPASYALLTAVADTILPTTDTPGAVAARVPAKLDGMLATWASPATRKAVADALGRIDAAALAMKKKGFVALSPVDRAAVLRPHDAAALKNVPPPPGAPKTNFFSQAVFVKDQGYLKIKDLVINLYYYSELGSANELEYIHAPGKFQPSIKLTPASRPYLGIGPF